MKKIFSITFTVLLILSVLPAMSWHINASDTPPSGSSSDKKTYATHKDLIQALAAKADGIKDYSLNFYYNGTQGTYIFDYRCVRPNNIRTRILDGKNARTTLLYLPNDKADSVKAKKGIFQAWKTIESLKIQNTPIVESLLDTFLKELQAFPDGTIKGVEKVTLSIGKEVSAVSDKGTISMDKASVVSTPEPSASPEGSPAGSPAPSNSPSDNASASPSASPSAQVTPTPEPSPEPSPEARIVKKVEKECIIVELKKDNISEIIAVDAETLWVVYMKKIIDGKLDTEAVVWDISENTSPKIEF